MIEKWSIHEIELSGPSEGNPFTDVQLSGRFCLGDRSIEAEGFYDGGGLYRIQLPGKTFQALRVRKAISYQSHRA